MVADTPSVKMLASSTGLILNGNPFVIVCRISAFPKAENVTVFFRKCSFLTIQNCSEWMSVWNASIGLMVIHFFLFAINLYKHF